jgi:L-ascorbate metabolism protein UlaG (beta-lactamase superfamily)
LGQSGFLLQWQGRHLLFDPYLSDSLTRKYAETDKPHVRMTERVIAPERLDFVDVVTSTHNHTDHLDAETLVPLLRANPRVVLVIPEANRQVVAERLQCATAWPTGLNDGETVEVAGFRVSGVPAAHETLEQDDHGRHKFLGYVVTAGPWTVYHSGDTLWYPQLVQKVGALRPRIALLPINGRAPERRVAGNLDGREAAELAHALGVDWVIPCHYDMFEFNTATPEEFVSTCRRLEQPYAILRHGERWSAR